MPPAHQNIDTPSPRSAHRGLLEGVLVGTIYGVLLRGFIVLEKVLQRHMTSFAAGGPQGFQHFMHLTRTVSISGQVMTLAFLLLGPTIIGYLTVQRIASVQGTGVVTWIAAPWLAVVCMMLIVALFAWEGAICVVMALPIALFFGSLGGLLAGLAARRHRLSTGRVLCVAFLPALLAPAETLLPSPLQTRTVHNQITIHAGPQTVWQNIERVPPITSAELQPNWTHRIGFPRPVEATLSFEGVGGVRHATFERGLTFIETVTAWQPQHRLAFSIRADSAHIPPTTLDEHVTIGGRYFDVLDGEYRLQALPDGSTVLHLTSHQRLSTDLNGYAGLWTDAVMFSLQRSILQVIQHRCEQTSALISTSHN